MGNPMLGTREYALRLLGILGPLVEFLGEEIGGLIKDLFEKLSSEKWEVWLTEFKKFLRRETCWSTRNPYLRSIATGKLVATVGKRVLAKMAKLFTGFLDGDFTNWGTDVPGEAKPETPFEVFEQVRDGKFAEIFAAFGVSLDKLCLSQDLIISFVENYADLLHPKGWATFFLFSVKFDEGTENERAEFFVADVRRGDDGRLEAYVHHLSRDGVWHAEDRYRFVFPQLPSVS